MLPAPCSRPRGSPALGSRHRSGDHGTARPGPVRSRLPAALRSAAARGSRQLPAPRGSPLAAPGRRAEQWEEGKGKGESAAASSRRPSAWFCLQETAEPDQGQGVERAGGGGGGGGRREGGSEGRRDEREPLSFPGLFFQFPVSHCAHSGYVLRLQVCPLLAAFLRLPAVGFGCRGAAADRDRHVTIDRSLSGRFSLLSRCLPSLSPSLSLSVSLSSLLPSLPSFSLRGGRSRCRLRADSGEAAAGPAGSRGGRRGAAGAPPPSATARPGLSGAASAPRVRAAGCLRRRLHLLKVTQPLPCLSAPGRARAARSAPSCSRRSRALQLPPSPPRVGRRDGQGRGRRCSRPGRGWLRGSRTAAPRSRRGSSASVRALRSPAAAPR